MLELGYSRTILKFNNLLQVQKNLCHCTVTLFLNQQIVYGLNNWSRDCSNNFAMKNCLFGTAKITRNAIKSKFTSSG